MRDVADRLEINELLARYCHALDQKDWPAFHAVFTDDATLDFTAFGGPKGTAGELEAFLAPVLDSLIASQHMVSTVIVDIDGDQAKARSAAIVPMTALAADGGEQTSLSGLWYEDQLVRTSAGWRIRYRRQVRGWAIASLAG
ncbi:nuclear transport factor 2 family protein [Sphingomonas sp. KC8]|uniref:nuclear transport factor 2 family protein n=1 Tax=Sphingomonas sp. KC8 TaxID=1030157 RepID=UPI00024897DA|nr:nuclear transport factor 2 family protein [Sphingomonas sp. KC8]